MVEEENYVLKEFLDSEQEDFVTCFKINLFLCEKNYNISKYKTKLLCKK